MSLITAQTIINKAAILLLDVSNVRWTRAELLGWLNDGQRAISLMKPDAGNKLAVLQLAAGTKQVLPTDAWLLLDIIRNMGTTGTTPGQAVRIMSRELIDGMNPMWHTTTASATTDNYIYNTQDQMTYYVYPPSDGTGYLEINYAQVPTDAATESSTLTLSDIYEPTLVDYIAYRCCSKDAAYAPGVRLAAAYYKSFVTSIGIKQQSELQSSPNLELGPRDPTVPGASN